MNFSRIFSLQKDLDQKMKIIHGHSNNEIRVNRILALLVELGEFANEYESFKYWKKNKRSDSSSILEEFVDGVHFLSSFVLELEIKETLIPEKIVSKDLNEQLLATYKSIIELCDDFSKDRILHCFSLYLGNAKLLNLSEKEIEEFYIKKNRINLERIKNNY